MRGLLIGTFVLTAAVDEPTHSNQVRFTGQTTAEVVLIKDVLQHILLFAAAEQKCESLSAVEAKVLPADYVPRDSGYRLTEAKVIYERWDALLCGHPTSFLVGFWPAAKGGFMFQVSHPMPDDVPSTGRP